MSAAPRRRARQTPRAALMVSMMMCCTVCARMPSSIATRPSPPDTRRAGIATGFTASAKHPLALVGVTVIDVSTGKLLPDQTLLIDGTRIALVGPTHTIHVPSGARVVDAKGKYAIPGLWNMHTHVEEHTERYTDFIVNGITGIREMSQTLGIDSLHKWRHEIASGVRVGPRIRGIAHRLWGVDGPPNEIIVATPADGRRIVDSLKASGADFIKVYENLSRETFFAIAAEARNIGIPLVGHLQATVSEVEASDSGQRSLEHMNELHLQCWYAPDSLPLPHDCVTMAERFKRNGTWFTPTLVRFDPFNNFSTRSDGCRPDSIGIDQVSGFDRTPLPGATDAAGFVHVVHALGRIHRAGIPLLAGSDGGLNVNLLGCSLHVELVLFVDAGLTPLEALQTATLNPAQFFDATDSLGTIATGKVADVVVLDANPLANIQNTKAIRSVIANGRYFDRTTLDALRAHLHQ